MDVFRDLFDLFAQWVLESSDRRFAGCCGFLLFLIVVILAAVFAAGYYFGG